jgi:hypothetical protein
MNERKASLMNVTYYDGIVPVDEETVAEWWRDGVERVRITFIAHLDDLLGADRMEGWSEAVDEIVGVSLTDLAYGFAQPETGDDLGDKSVLMYVEGSLDAASLRFALGREV